MERFLAKTFALRFLFYLLLYNFHFQLSGIELTTILASVYSILIFFNKRYTSKKLYIFYFLIFLFSLLTKYYQLFPHAIFGVEIGIRIYKLKSKDNILKLIIILFSSLNLYIFYNGISKFESVLGLSQITVLSHVQALLFFLFVRKSFILKHKKFILIYFITSFLVPVRSLVFLLTLILCFTTFDFLKKNSLKIFLTSLVILIFGLKFLLKSNILPESGDSIKYRLAILEQTFNFVQLDEFEFKNKIYETSQVNLDHIESFSFDNTLLQVKTLSILAFIILFLLILYSKAEVLLLFLILDDYTNGLQFLLLTALLLTFYLMKHEKNYALANEKN